MRLFSNCIAFSEYLNFTTDLEANFVSVSEGQFSRMMAEKISLKWNDFYFNVSKSFRELRHEEYLQDVTLVSDDNTQISAHKLVLSACSEHFKIECWSLQLQ